MAGDEGFEHIVRWKIRQFNRPVLQSEASSIGRRPSYQRSYSSSMVSFPQGMFGLQQDPRHTAKTHATISSYMVGFLQSDTSHTRSIFISGVRISIPIIHTLLLLTRTFGFLTMGVLFSLDVYKFYLCSIPGHVLQDTFITRVLYLCKTTRAI